MHGLEIASVGQQIRRGFPCGVCVDGRLAQNVAAASISRVAEGLASLGTFFNSKPIFPLFSGSPARTAGYRMLVKLINSLWCVVMPGKRVGGGSTQRKL